MRKDIPLEDAISCMKKHVSILTDMEEVSIMDAAGRILGEDIYASHDQPPFHKSAVDGYAICYEDSIGASFDTPCTLDVIDCVYAGGYTTKEVNRGQAIQIMTGACVPKGANCVVRLEDSNDDIHNLHIYKEQKHDSNICHQGEDYVKGSVLLKKYDYLDPARLAIASSAGIHTYKVLRKLKVGLIISGDEIIPLQEPLRHGKIYDSNFAYIYHRLQQMGYEVSSHAYVQDDVYVCAEKLVEFTKQVDIIITTGGVSVGKKDILHEALDYAQAEKIFWKVQVKPGTPAMFSMLYGIPILSLSGNPFAAGATFEVLARELLAYMQQNKTQQPWKKEGILTCSFGKYSERRRLVRAIYKDGFVYIPEGMHASGTLKTLIGCNCIMDIPAGSPALQAQDKVSVWMLGGKYE